MLKWCWKASPWSKSSDRNSKESLHLSCAGFSSLYFHLWCICFSSSTLSSLPLPYLPFLSSFTQPPINRRVSLFHSLVTGRPKINHCKTEGAVSIRSDLCCGCDRAWHHTLNTYGLIVLLSKGKYKIWLSLYSPVWHLWSSCGVFWGSIQLPEVKPVTGQSTARKPAPTWIFVSNE